MHVPLDRSALYLSNWDSHTLYRSFAVVPWLVHIAVEVPPNRRADCFGAELLRIGDVHQLDQVGLASR